MKRMCAVAAVLCLFLGCFVSCAPAAAHGQSLCISEVCTAGEDWVEVLNYGNEAVDLTGWYLSDDPQSPGKSALPATVLAAGERLVLRADTTDRTALAFRLNAAGEAVVLSNPQGKAVSTVTVPASVPGVSYGCVETEAFPPERYVWYASPTPAQSNENGMMLGESTTATQYGVRLNEYMARNKSVLYDEEGDYGDWVELYNFSDNAVDLSGFTLTDAKEDIARWQFPAGTTLPAGGYLVVFLDGKNKQTASGELHADFKLGQSDGFLGLYTPTGAFCSGISCDEQNEQDVSYGCTPAGEVRRCRYPTPRAANAVDETEVTAP